MTEETKHNYLLNIPNNEEGTYFLHLFNKYLNKKTYKIRVRGRQPQLDKIKKIRNLKTRDAKRLQKNMNEFGGIPKDVAGYYGIYLLTQTQQGWTQLDRNTAINEEKHWKNDILIFKLKKELETITNDINDIKNKIEDTNLLIQTERQ
jgi:hypothetical protein